jgi:hypothetical protein
VLIILYAHVIQCNLLDIQTGYERFGGTRYLLLHGIYLEKLVPTYQTTLCPISKDGNLNIHGSEIFLCHVVRIIG